MIFPQSLKISMFTATNHIQMIWAANKSDTFTSSINKMLGCLLSSLIAISYHLREFVLKTSTSKEHQRFSHGIKLFKMRIIHSILGKASNNSLNMHIKEILNSFRLTLVTLMTVCTNHTIAITCSIVFNTIKHRCIIMSN